MGFLCYSPGCPGTHSIDQAGLELRNPPASASQSAGITGVRYHRPAKLTVKQWESREKTFADSYPGCTEGGILTREDGGLHFEAFFIEEKLLPQAAKDIAESILPAGWTQKEDRREAANICS
ncbi:Membrane metallo-endopeptidase-like 1 [Apodemus speciosus]|uniref:Membrane metallo-endopeptidase-like 1 n=1 Tax=Apodemus speciosus TaxID=105296 RepID=A0ABQ0EWG8_APOSI